MTERTTVPAMNLQIAQSRDITRLARRDFPWDFRRANHLANVHGFFGALATPSLLWIFVLGAFAPGLLYPPTTVFTVMALSSIIMLCVLGLFGFYELAKWSLNRLSMKVDERFHVRLCDAGWGEVVVESGSQDLETVPEEMYETRAFLEAQRSRIDAV